MYNGDYYITAETTWDLSTNGDNSIEELQSFFQATSTPIMVTVSNEISFPELVDEFGDGMMSFDIALAYAEAEWQVDVYDSQFNYIKSFAGYTDNGLIEVIWDVTDANGNPLDDLVFYSVTTIWYAAGGSGTGSTTRVNPPKFKISDNYPPVGKWVVAWQNVFQHNYEKYKNEPPPSPNMLNAMLAAYSAGSRCGGHVRPQPGTPGDFFGIRFGTNASVGEKVLDWAQLKVALRNFDARNLYFFGHGSKNKLGASKDSRLTLTSDEVASILKINDPNPTNRHAFRYVFLDGCKTANGDFPTSFGIRKKENVPIEAYQKNRLRPSAFSGWTDFKQIALFDEIPWQFPAYRIQFFFYWSYGYENLAGAHERARIECRLPGWRIGEDLRIFGYRQMMFNDYNTNP